MRPWFLPALLGCLMGASCARKPTDHIEATGTLDVIEIEVSPTSAGRVSRVLVDEGAEIHAGDTLAILTTPTLTADMAQREAKSAAAAAALLEARHGPRAAEIETASAELASAEATAAHASEELARIRSLNTTKMASVQELDAARATAGSATAHRNALRAQLDLVRAGTRPERVTAAEADAVGARASVASARATASDLVLLSPIDGTVTTRSAQPGAVIAAGQSALTVAESHRLTVRVYVSEGVLPRVRVGQVVHAALDEFPGSDFTGRVVALSSHAEYTPRVALTKREREDLLFGVKVEFRDTTGMLKAGLPLTVQIKTPGPAPIL